MFLFPVFFLPVVIDSLGVGKNWFLEVSALLGLVVWIVGVIINRKIEIKVNKPFWGVLLLSILGVISWYRLEAGIQMRSVMNPLGIGTLLALAVWMFLWLQVTDKEEFDKQFNFLSWGGVIVAITSLLVFLMPASRLPFSWPKDNPIISLNSGWSLTGSLLNEAIFLLFLVFGWVKRLLIKIKEKSVQINYLMEAAAVGFLGLVLFLDIYKIFKFGWVVLDGYSAWVIAVETLKRSPIWGVGMGNFLQAFTSFRPVSFNLTKNWAMAFGGSSMGLLHIWTEMGIIGLVFVSWFASMFMKQKKSVEFWRMALFLVILLALPLNLMVVFLVVWLAANKLFEVKQSNLLVLKLGENNFDIMPWLFSAVLLTGIGFGGYWLSGILLGDVYMRSSLVAASKNDGVKTYESQIKAIAANPYNSDYRKLYSQTNLAIALNLLANKEITDEDKQKASTLIQQAVREGKAAVSMDTNNSDYWTNLALIYKSLVGAVDQSADWSYQAYQQAVALDSANPLLRLDMGGLLYAAGRFDDADRVFEQVVMSKNDLANGWYNWAYTAKNNNRLADAVARLAKSLELVPVDSGDYDKASEELNKWKKELDELNAQNKTAQTQGAVPAAPETLKTPQPLPTMGKEEKVNVPAVELQPPAVQPQTVPADGNQVPAANQ
jgi:tetratricopeptide (TPR) repeat protein